MARVRRRRRLISYAPRRTETHRSRDFNRRPDPSSQLSYLPVSPGGQSRAGQPSLKTDESAWVSPVPSTSASAHGGDLKRSLQDSVETDSVAVSGRQAAFLHTQGWPGNARACPHLGAYWGTRAEEARRRASSLVRTRPWPCKNSERAFTEGNHVLPAPRFPSRLAIAWQNIGAGKEGRCTCSLLPPAFSHGQDPKRSLMITSIWGP